MIPTFWTIIGIVAIILIFCKIPIGNLHWWQIIALAILIYVFAPVLAGIAFLYILLTLARY